MINSKEFWNKRAQTHGHTGWNNPVFYIYDQILKKYAFAQMIKDIPFIKKDHALDFGCGVGDFSKILSESFKNVIGCDLSSKVIDIAKQKYKSLEFISIDRVGDLPLRKNSQDFIISIGVVDLIMDDHLLRETISYFYETLDQHGIILLLEYSFNEETPSSSYQRKNTRDQWRQLFTLTGFKVEKEIGYANIATYPSRSGKIYKWLAKASLANRLIKRFPKLYEPLLYALSKTLVYFFKDYETSPARTDLIAWILSKK